MANTLNGAAIGRLIVEHRTESVEGQSLAGIFINGIEVSGYAVNYRVDGVDVTSTPAPSVVERVLSRRAATYTHPDLLALIEELTAEQETVTAEMVDAVARKALELTPWEGPPIAWDTWTDANRSEARRYARIALEEALGS